MLKKDARAKQNLDSIIGLLNNLLHKQCHFLQIITVNVIDVIKDKQKILLEFS